MPSGYTTGGSGTVSTFSTIQVQVVEVDQVEIHPLLQQLMVDQVVVVVIILSQLVDKVILLL